MVSVTSHNRITFNVTMSLLIRSVKLLSLYSEHLQLIDMLTEVGVIVSIMMSTVKINIHY